MDCKIECKDGQIDVPATFIENCNMLLTQQECSDFKNIYMASCSINEIKNALLLCNTKYIKYDRTLDYLGYKYLIPYEYECKFENIYKLIKNGAVTIDLTDQKNISILNDIRCINTNIEYCNFLLHDKMEKFILLSISYTVTKEPIEKYHNEHKYETEIIKELDFNHYKLSIHNPKIPKKLILNVNIELIDLLKYANDFVFLQFMKNRSHLRYSL